MQVDLNKNTTRTWAGTVETSGGRLIYVHSTALTVQYDVLFIIVPSTRTRLPVATTEHCQVVHRINILLPVLLSYPILILEKLLVVLVRCPRTRSALRRYYILTNQRTVNQDFTSIQ